MNLLAIETATKAGSIAVVTDEAFVGEVRLDVSITHSERLMDSIVWLLKSSLLSIHDIDAFAVSIGPGSFTGLRIGLSTAKGLAFAAKKPLLPVPTLDAFARRFPFCSYFICPMLDARRDEVYTALYKWENGICKKIIPEEAAAPSQFIKRIDGPALFTGDGAAKYKNIIAGALRDDAVFPQYSLFSPSASSVAEIAVEMLGRGEGVDPAGLTPFYIRKSEAEIRWKA
ncbi:MAG: tRNA (adenosine(37)-N6)-threonylcarbamoyltransferase complex dimerization subunit type 1 TsaB [Nitrospirae bacterium]|nr:tRNA (adenosine(37)-N6)-threonylcarbamoyltransferase complex dimerization subunit type 1 TsaB [Nitrospirota bacterium]